MELSLDDNWKASRNWLGAHGLLSVSLRCMICDLICAFLNSVMDWSEAASWLHPPAELPVKRDVPLWGGATLRWCVMQSECLRQHSTRLHCFAFIPLKDTFVTQTVQIWRNYSIVCHQSNLLLCVWMSWRVRNPNENKTKTCLNSRFSFLEEMGNLSKPWTS